MKNGRCLAASLTACIGLLAMMPASAQDDPSGPFRPAAPSNPTPTSTSVANPAPTHGHSMQGEAFNEGPRQHAYLMKGMGKVDFPVTTKNPLAQKFFNQGVAQLHGFWYFEAERSFRQVVAIDPECVMAYWGMAMANVNNANRAKEFIQKAVEKEAKASPREKMWIDCLAASYKPGVPSKTKARTYVKALEAITRAYPNDLEAQAFLCLEIWENNWEIPIFSYRVLDTMMNRVLAKNPMHPLHHYRIHLWNIGKDANALNSAALCGPSSAGIAHMWHMPGHTYSGLQRYADAAWQQEASARVDHAHMIRDWVLPDQIHNYAHNNQWLIEDLDYIGRVHDALDLAKNMVELPRHPQYNTVSRGSAAEGRRRLFQVLMDYELWDDLLALTDSAYLDPTDQQDQQKKRLYARGIAFFSKGDLAHGQDILPALDSVLEKERLAFDKVKGLADDSPDKQKASYQVKTTEGYLNELRGYSALLKGQNAEAIALFDKADYLSKERKARLYLQMNDKARAVALAREAASSQTNQVMPQASLVDVLYRCGKREEANVEFKKLRELSGSIDYRDMNTPIFHRLSEIAPELGQPVDWRLASTPKADIGKRPPLDSLGPFRWHPSSAPAWSLPDANGKRVSLADFRKQGKPVLVVFYLGSGCPQCMEQLNAFAPVSKEFQEAGISIVAVGSDTVAGIKQTCILSKDGKEKVNFPFPLLSDNSLKAFKAYRAYDDFEKMPLHGTFLIDGQGQVRWQDISFKPFKETRFLLTEAQRLLKQAQVVDVPEKAVKRAATQ